MSIITVDDVRTNLAGLKIETNTVPTSDQVDEMIDIIESEVRSYIEERDWAWPTDPTSNAFKFLKQTVLEGVKSSVLRAKYVLTQELPQEAIVSRNMYTDRLRRLQNNLLPAAMFTGAQTPRYNGPILVNTDPETNFGETFEDYTMRMAGKYRSPPYKVW